MHINDLSLALFNNFRIADQPSRSIDSLNRQILMVELGWRCPEYCKRWFFSESASDINIGAACVNLSLCLAKIRGLSAEEKTVPRIDRGKRSL